MSKWSARDWAIFLGAVTAFLGTVGPLYLQMRRELKKVKRNTGVNAQALVPLIRNNNADPTTRDVDPAIANAVQQTAEASPPPPRPSP